MQSQLMAGINAGRAPSQVIRITAYDLLVSTNRPTGGDHYKRLEHSFTRLRSSQVVTNIKTNGVHVKRGFGFIDYWEIIERSETDNRMASVEVKLSDWLYNAVLGTELLTINRDYFRLRGGLERRFYEIARKHCGTQSKWTIGVPLLHKKSGAKCLEKVFRSRTKKIINADVLPDYRVRYDLDKDQVSFYSRTGSKASRAVLSDQLNIKSLTPKKPTMRAGKQIVLDLG